MVSNCPDLIFRCHVPLNGEDKEKKVMVVVTVMTVEMTFAQVFAKVFSEIFIF